MKYSEIANQIAQKNTCLCVGLDTDIHKLPHHLRGRKDGMILFNKTIIDATKDLCVAYKINTAFYECLGAEGWEIMAETLSYIPANCFTIADAKRGDIGNTSTMYAKAFFDKMNFDAITVSPYMGSDSIKPFLEFPDKFTIVLALTSNAGSVDFEQQKVGKDFLFESVLKTSMQWGSHENMMYVVGATKAEALSSIREIVPNHFLLIPGVGAQGGSLEEVLKYGAIKQYHGLLVNSSRQILYASSEEDYLECAVTEAKKFAGSGK